jgi:hypothetical protein
MAKKKPDDKVVAERRRRREQRRRLNAGPTVKVRGGRGNLHKQPFKPLGGER